MAKASMHVAYSIFLLTFCIDGGDGRWKKTDREILQRDINLFKKIAERVEHELQEYYDEYVDDGRERIYASGEDYSQVDENVPISSKNEDNNGLVKKVQPLLSKETQISNDIPIYSGLNVNDSESVNERIKNNTTKKLTSTDKKWPKFEDILLAIGKKYDWKNDRWIKVKEKFKNKHGDDSKSENSIMFQEKHRFSYRSIKLNRGKNKRNVVIAVTAIR